MKMKVYVITILLVLLHGCGNSAATISHESVVSSSTHQSKYSWLDDVICQPPCWHGIVPNSTTMEDGLDALESHPFVELDPISVSSHSGQLDWRWKNSDSNGGAIYAANNQVVVSHIVLNVDIPVPFSTLRSRLGEPSYALLLPFERIHSSQFDWHVYVIYVDKGLLFSHVTDVPPDTWNNVVFDHIEYMQPDKSVLQDRIPDTAPLRQWAVNNDIMSYCYEVYNTVDPCQ